MVKKKKVGILTLYYKNYNFGALLQSYALQLSIQKMGYDCELILYDWRSNLYKKVLMLKDKAELKEFIEFEQSIPHGNKLYTPETILYANEEYDIFVCGSDQVWNDQLSYTNEFSRQDFYLHFVTHNKLRVFYAASMGKVSLFPQTQIILKDALRKADAISVREKSAKNYLQGLCQDIQVEHVLDPTMLVDVEEWRRIAMKPNISEPYVLLYLLATAKRGNDIRKYAQKIAAENGYKLVVLPCANIGPREFLGLVDNAELVLTDSFHGTIFSILFHKNYRVFGHRDEQDPQQTNARMYDLCEMFELHDRIGNVNNPEKLKLEQSCNFDIVDDILRKKKEKSFEFLRNALAIEKTDFYITEKRKCYGCGCCKSVCEKNAITFLRDEEGFEYPVIDQEKCDRCGACRTICPACLPERRHPLSVVSCLKTSRESEVKPEIVLGELIMDYGKRCNQSIHMGTGCDLLNEKVSGDADIFIEVPCGGQLSPLIEENLKAVSEQQDMRAHLYNNGNGFRLCCYGCLYEKTFKGDLYLTHGEDKQVILMSTSEKGEKYLHKFLSWYLEKNEEQEWQICKSEFLPFQLGLEGKTKGICRVFLFSDIRNNSIDEAYHNDMYRMQKRTEEMQQFARTVMCETYRRESCLLIQQIKEKMEAEACFKLLTTEVVIYGAGIIGRKLNELFAEKVLCFIDQGKKFDELLEVDGKPVFHLNAPGLNELLVDKDGVKIIVTPGWDFEEIKINCQKSLQEAKIDISKICFEPVAEFLKEVCNE